MPVARATKEDCGPVGLTKLQSRERLLLLLLLLLLVILLWLLWLLRLPLLLLLSLDDAGDTTSGCMTDWANISARSACNQPESIVKARSGKRIRWSTWSKLSQHWMDHGELDGLDGSSLRSSWPRVTWPCPMPNPMPTLIFSHVIRSVSQSVGNSTRGAHDMLWHSNSLKESSENKQVQVPKAQEFFFKQNLKKNPICQWGTKEATRPLELKSLDRLNTTIHRWLFPESCRPHYTLPAKPHLGWRRQLTTSSFFYPIRSTYPCLPEWQSAHTRSHIQTHTERLESRQTSNQSVTNTRLLMEEWGKRSDVTDLKIFCSLHSSAHLSPSWWNKISLSSSWPNKNLFAYLSSYIGASGI